MKILVVDDSRMIRQTIRKELEDGGYEVIEAKNGLEGLARLATPSPPDLITLDIEMPKLNGFDTCQKFRGERYSRFFSHCPDNRMPVIFVTGNDTMEDRKRGFQLEAADFISKPFPKGAILSAVNKVLKPAQLVQGMTALVVDDSGVARHIVCEYLRREGLAIIQAEDGLEALEILDLSKAKAEQTELKMDPIVLSQVIQTSVNSLGQMAAGKSQTIQLQDPCEGAIIMGNASGLGRVFNNLLSNAIKFTPDNGTIHLTIEPSPPGNIQVRVVDTGIGISEDKIPYLFDQFTSTSQSGTSGEVGTGLGMSIVKEILEKHGVPIEVESKTGKGTCFTLTFPLTDEAPIDKPVVSAPSGPAAEKKQLNILLAEDNPVNQKLAEKMLTKSGHRVTVAGNGKEAFLKYSDSPEKIDLIFMDIQMPEMDGLESTRTIRAFEKEKDVPKVPIVAMTGQAMDGDREKCLETGMNDYIVKPINKTIVLDIVEKWTSGAPQEIHSI